MTLSPTDFDRDLVEDASMSELAKHEAAREAALSKPAEGKTLLWNLPARAITTLTGIGSFSIRTGAKITGWGIAAGKEGTLRTLRANQAIAEAILFAAGKDVGQRNSDYATQEADNIIAKWVSAVHYGLTTASIATTIGFNTTQYVVRTGEYTVTRSLSFLNAIFGSTESSRAVAAIMSLMKREYSKPGIDGREQQPGFLDLFAGIVGFVILQRQFKRQTEVAFRNANGEATVWDVVIDDKGFRADVIGLTRNAQQGVAASTTTEMVTQNTLSVSPPENHILTLDVQQQAQVSDEEIQQRIMTQLPPGTSATITSESLLTKTVQVDVHDADTLHLEPPPGMVMVSEHLPQPVRGTGHTYQSVVFRTMSKDTSQAHVHASAPAPAPTANQKKSRRPAPVDPSSPPTERPSRLPVASSHGRTNSKSSIKKVIRSITPHPVAALTSLKRSRGTSMGLSDMQPLSQADSVFQMTSARTTPATTPGATTPKATPSSDALNGITFTVHRRRRTSIQSQTDSISVYSNDSRPPSPTLSRAQIRTSNALTKTCSQTEIHATLEVERGSEGLRHHQRSKSFVPSLYSMGSRNPEEDTLILQPRTALPEKSVFEDDATLIALAESGKVPGQFPDRHLIWTLQRFARFASASYGENFLKFFGLSVQSESSMAIERAKAELHTEHTSFSTYTGLPAETIVKSSFVDDKGVASANGSSFSPLIHFISIDMESKAIVLTCRGTLGFEDLLTDAACGYADLYWQGQRYTVHEGVRDAARRLLDSANGNRVMATLKELLNQYPEYGLVLCGHSLGGAVAAFVAIMIAEPSKTDPNRYCIAQRPRLIASESQSEKEIVPISLPAGRAIHVYAFGSPAIVSQTLRAATRGLVTSVVNANDVVPTLSLGTLHDFRAMTNHMKNDIYGGFETLKQRVGSQIRQSISSYFWADPVSEPVLLVEEEHTEAGKNDTGWAWDELQSLRQVMQADKLYPPGEIFVLESTRVFDKHDENGKFDKDYLYAALGRAATRVQLKYIRDVERRFAEIKFGSTMFIDHSPAKYEGALASLVRGVLED